MSTNIPQPVPSKAAIRALRGLVLGTSCTLALVTEDRRRRINAARSAIRNGDRIRSARQYNQGGGSFVAALEDESFVTDPEMVHWNTTGETEKYHVPKSSSMPISTSRTPPSTSEPNSNPPSPPGRLVAWSGTTSSQQSISQQARLLLSESLPAASLAAALKNTVPPADATAKHAEQRSNEASPQSAPASLITPSSLPMQIQAASLAQQAREYQSRTRIPSLPAISKAPFNLPAATARIVGLTNADDIAHLQAAVKVLASTALEATSAADIPPEQLQSLWDVAAKLCATCQEANRLDLAQQVLRVSVGYGQLDEDVYFAHNPLPVVKALADELKAVIDSGILSPNTTPPSAVLLAERKAFIQRLRDTAALFLPPLTSYSGKHTASEVVELAQQLLECSLAVGHQRSTRSIYASVISCPGDVSEFTCWYIDQLQKSDNYKLIVWSFLSRPPQSLRLSGDAFFALGDSVVKAVPLSHSPRAGEVLQTLLSMSFSDRQLRTTWVTELLYCHWRKARDYEQLRNLFAEITSHGNISKKVHHKDGAYRVMIQISLEAGKPAEAQAYYDELASLDATAAGDIRLLALFALAKANEGNWQGVHADFQKAVDAAGPGGLPARETERAFVPIVKQFIKSHTIGETEEFVKLYVDGFGIPIGHQMVTLLANEYGALREVNSFVAWLDYCAHAGFAVDAAFSNAILQNCRKHWKFPFRDLRTLYHKLRVLSPSFEDRVTQNIMMHAAISGGKPGGRAVQGRVVSLRLHSNGFHTKSGGDHFSASPISKVRYRDENDLLVVMKKAFAAGNPTKVVRVYKKVVRSGMPLSDKTLKVAVGAAIRGQGKSVAYTCGSPLPADVVTAVDLLREAHKAGQDIDAASSYVVMACVEDIKPGSEGGKRAVGLAVESMLTRLEKHHIRVSDLVLNRAAFHLLKVGHIRGAITLALSAANTAVGGGQPGYNVWNFAVLVSAYAHVVDPNGLRLAIEGAAASGVSSDTLGYKILKRARRNLLRRSDHVGGINSDSNSSGHGDNKPHDKKHKHKQTTTTTTTTLSQVQLALQVVEDGLRRGHTARRQLEKDRQVLETSTISIMKQAALDAGCGPIGGNGTPVSLRQSKSKPKPKNKWEEDLSEAELDQELSNGSWDILDLPLDKEDDKTRNGG